MVSIHNYQMYRHIEHPGWRLSWNWTGKEVIWNTVGSETTEQGDCSRVGAANARPHCCQRRPVMVDLPPGTPYNRQVANCCRGGVLSSLVQNNLTSTAAFQMVVGEFALAKDDGSGNMEPEKPWHFDIGVPGYTCSNATTVAPTRVKVDKNRYEQVLRKAFPFALHSIPFHCVVSAVKRPCRVLLHMHTAAPPEDRAELRVILLLPSAVQ
jgi:hypothetical protein